MIAPLVTVLKINFKNINTFTKIFIQNNLAFVRP